MTALKARSFYPVVGCFLGISRVVGDFYPKQPGTPNSAFPFQTNVWRFVLKVKRQVFIYPGEFVEPSMQLIIYAYPLFD